MNIRTSAECRRLFDAVCRLHNTTPARLIQQSLVAAATQRINEAVRAGVLHGSEAQVPFAVERGERGWAQIYEHLAGTLELIFQRDPAFVLRSALNHRDDASPWLNEAFFAEQCRLRGIEQPTGLDTPAGLVATNSSGRMVAFDAPVGAQNET
ncbi:MAG: hypothetical protein ACREXT_06340 [Gammaproteobacteria bacterium]